MTSYDENKKMFLNYLETHVFEAWKNNDTYTNSLELIVSPICNTECSYCYYKNFHSKLYPKDIRDPNTIVENCKKVLDWMALNEYNPRTIEIFSGEFFNLPWHREILDLILSYSERIGKRIFVSIPTNGTFALSEKSCDIVQNEIDYYESKGLRLGLSLSIDGKYLDNDTRHIRNGKQYTDEFYDRLFKFSDKNHLCFHPMIGAKGISKWKDTFVWFIDNIMKYKHCSKREAFDWLYLLDVRNPDWTTEELDELEDFIKFLANYTFEVYDSKEEYYNEFLRKSKLNIFSPLITTVGRGLGCGIQQCFAVRLGDLALVPCHRTAYDGYNACHLKFNGKELDVELENPLLYMMIMNFDSQHIDKCINCPINHMCNKFCLGCNYEVNKDMFTLVDTVCDLNIKLISASVKALDDLGMSDYIMDDFGHTYRGDMPNLKKIVEYKKLLEYIRISEKENK